MNKLPSRSDEIYKEIESFEDYEFSQCVAYEMAIRNEDNLKQVEELKKLYFSCMEDIQDDELIKFECTNELVNKIDKIDFLSYDYEEKRLNIHYILEKTYFMEKESISPFSSKIDSLNARNGNKTQINRRKGYNITIDLNHINEINLNDIIVGKEKICHINHLSSKGISINANFKRPQIKIQDKTKSINASLQLDINKPLNELIAYITHIKKDLEENKDILKAPIELLGEEIQKADDISKMCIKNKNGKKFCFDGRNGVLKTQKFADMFFIYDMNKLGVKESKIRVMIDEHYDPNNEKESGMSQDTFRKYLHIAKDYIDNQRYKEIITGVKP